MTGIVPKWKLFTVIEIEVVDGLFLVDIGPGNPLENCTLYFWM